MGLDFVERFFKLTLDNVYRFICSSLFWVALVACVRQISPIKQLGELLDWLAIPSAWLAQVGEWILRRHEVVGLIAVLVLMVAVAFAAANGRLSRSGATSLLSIVFLVQVEQGAGVAAEAVILLVGFALVTGITTLTAHRLGRSTPEWPRSVWARVGDGLLTLVLAAFYLASPLGWLISQEPYDVRGTRLNPLYIEQVEASGPRGAIHRR